MTEIPERVVLDKLGTPDGSVYRIHAWQNGNLVVATVLPRDLALARLIDLGYEPDAAPRCSKTPRLRRGGISETSGRACHGRRSRPDGQGRLRRLEMGDHVRECP